MAMEKSWKARDVAFSVVGEEEEDDAVAAIPPPQTPLEPMEYLSRSWSVSASEISKILVGGGKKSGGVTAAAGRLPEMSIPEDSVLATSTVPVPCHQQHVTPLTSLRPLRFFFFGYCFDVFPHLIHG
jgi:hypothetical protein